MSVEPIHSEGTLPGPPAPARGHALGPLVRTRAMYQPLVGRLSAAAILLACGGVLAVAAMLRPDARGMGTHEQLSFVGRPVGACGFPEHVGIPCPSCGMTTAFAYTVRGQFWRAMVAQPMGFLLAVGAAVAACLAAWSAVAGRVIEVNWYRVDATRVVFLIMLGFVVAWGYKTAAFLLDGPMARG